MQESENEKIKALELKVASQAEEIVKLKATIERLKKEQYFVRRKKKTKTTGA